MVVNSHITDSATKMTAEVVKNDACGCQALAVATVPYRDFDNKLDFFKNDTYGIEMNQNAGFGGTAIKIHDGTDNSYWTAQDVVGTKTVYNSTDQNHTTAGTKSIKCDNLPVGEIFEIDKGSAQDLTGHIAFTMWVYVDKDWKAGDAVDFYGWLSTGTPAQVGTKVDLSDYFEYTDYDVWHKITIPLVDMGLTDLTIDTVRIKQEAAEGKAPKFYLDDVQIEETGTPIVFELKPAKGTWLLVKSFQIVCAATGTAAEPNIPYDSLLGTSIANGIDYKRIENEVTTSAFTINKFVDFMGLSNANITGQGGDATNNWVAVNVRFNEAVVLKAEDDDKMTLTINDDLSGLLYLRSSAGAKEEVRK